MVDIIKAFLGYISLNYSLVLSFSGGYGDVEDRFIILSLVVIV
jgi:hypothetical protein